MYMCERSYNRTGLDPGRGTRLGLALPVAVPTPAALDREGPLGSRSAPVLLQELELHGSRGRSR